MTNISCERRRLINATCFVALSICALATDVGDVSADTLRSALYQFEVPRPVAAGTDLTVAESSVYMRVSNADRITSDPANPFDRSPVKSTNGFALFEFFLADDAQGVTLQRVRFHDRRDPAPTLGELHRILSVNGASLSETSLPYRLALSSKEKSSVTIDLPGNTKSRGVGAGEVVGLMFALAPGETIDSLIDRWLAGGKLKPEIQLRRPRGNAYWAVLSRCISVSPRGPRPATDNILAAHACPAASSSPVSSQAAYHAWTTLTLDQTHRPSECDLVRKVCTVVLPGTRAREPPVNAQA